MTNNSDSNETPELNILQHNNKINIHAVDNESEAISKSDATTTQMKHKVQSYSQTQRQQNDEQSNNNDVPSTRRR